MPLTFFRGFRRTAALGLVAALGLSANAYALFPPPFYNPPPVKQQGDPEPEPPDMPPPPNDTPPDTPCECQHCTTTNNTPEPTTIVSAVLGASVIGGMALRRRKK